MRIFRGSPKCSASDIRPHRHSPFVLTKASGAWDEDSNVEGYLGVIGKAEKNIKVVGDSNEEFKDLPEDCDERSDASDDEEPQQVQIELEAPAHPSENVKPKRHPEQLTEKEMEEHSLTHCPYRSWCKNCIEAQGKEDQHPSHHGSSGEIPSFSMDYKELSEYIEQVKRKITIMVMREKKSKMNASYVVKAKGSTEQSKKIVEFIDSFGHGKVSIKSDNEDAIKVLRDEIIRQRKAQTVPAGSVHYHLETHGTAEKAVQDIIVQIRKLKMALESRIQCHLSIDLPIMEWLVEHAARLLNCHSMGHDGKVPYKRAESRDPCPTQVEFGEQVYAKMSRIDKKSARKNPLNRRAIEATWVGIHDATIEDTVIGEDGKALELEPSFAKLWLSDGVKIRYWISRVFHPNLILRVRM